MISRSLFPLLVVAAMGTAPQAQARPVCGPTHGRTLAHDAQARVYERGGSVRSCRHGRAGSLRLGSARPIIDAQIAGRYASIRRRTSAGQSLAVYDLRSAKLVDKPQRYRRFRIIRLDSTGVAVVHAIQANGHGVVADTTGRIYTRVDRVDDVGLKGWLVAYRKGDTVTIKDRDSESTPAQPASDGTLLQIGDIHFDAVGTHVRVRSGEGPWVTLDRFAAHDDCSSRSDCSGWGPMRLVGHNLAVPYIDISIGTDITTYDLTSGTTVAGR